MMVSLHPQPFFSRPARRVWGSDYELCLSKPLPSLIILCSNLALLCASLHYINPNIGLLPTHVLTNDDALGSQHQRHNDRQSIYLRLLLWKRGGLQLELEYRQTDNHAHNALYMHQSTRFTILCDRLGMMRGSEFSTVTS